MLSTPYIVAHLASLLRSTLPSDSPWRVLSAIRPPEPGENNLVGIQPISETEAVPGNYTMKLSLELQAYSLGGDDAFADALPAHVQSLSTAFGRALDLLHPGYVLSAPDGSATTIISRSASTLQQAGASPYLRFFIPFTMIIQQ